MLELRVRINRKRGATNGSAARCRTAEIGCNRLTRFFAISAQVKFTQQSNIHRVRKSSG
jgi:hypothetical protein